jgi:hypothetical protein
MSIIIAVLIWFLVLWLISIMPVPASPFPIQTLLYIMVTVVLILYLWRFV